MNPAGGGGSAIMEAMKRRGFSGGVTNQVSPTAPSASSAIPPMPISLNSPKGMPPMGRAASDLGMPQPEPSLPATKPPESGEAQVISTALSQRLLQITRQNG